MERIIIEGNLDTSGSYAIVNIALAEALLELGFDVSLLPFDVSSESLSQYLYLKNSKLRVADKRATCEVRIRQVWPPIWTRADKNEKLIVIQPWEYGSIPISWIEGINSVDQIWVPSAFVKACYVQSGVDHAKVRVVANGISADAVALGASKISAIPPSNFNEPLKLLFLGGAIFRKGADLLIDGIAQLSADERSRIRLTIKKVGSRGAYQGQSLVEQKLAEHPELQGIIKVMDDHLGQAELYDLIQRSDALIHPYRGEGFGLPVLEAMALGTPVIHTANGATNEFCTPDASVLIKSETIVQDIPLVDNNLLADRLWYLESSPIEIASTLRNVLNYRNELPTLASKAHEKSKRYLWDQIALHAQDNIRSLFGSESPIDTFKIISSALAIQFDKAANEQQIIQTIQLLTNLGDFHSALTLADSALTDSSNQLKQIRQQLFGVASSRKDLWSKSIHRELINNLSASKSTRLVAHAFEGSDDQTYQIAMHLSQYFTGRQMILDIGCGQGSMLRALREKGVDAIGIEGDPELVAKLVADGFTVYEGWLPEALNGINLPSFDGVFMGHIIEHLLPSQAEKIFEWIYSRIEDGGTILLQTPDFTNPYVSSFNFWLDSTHIRPYPIELMKEMLKAAGFAPIEGACRRISEIAPLDAITMAKKVGGASRNSSLASSEFIEQSSDNISVAHIGLFQGHSGFAKDCGSLLNDPPRSVQLNRFDATATDYNDEYAPLAELKGSAYGAVIVNTPLSWFPSITYRTRAKIKIARTTWEAWPVPKQVANSLKQFDQIWTFSEYDRSIFIASGLDPDNVKRIPIIVDKITEVPTPTPAARPFTYLSIFDFQDRKDPASLVRAFERVAALRKDSHLNLKVNGISGPDFVKFIEANLRHSENSSLYGKITLITESLSPSQLKFLYNSSDVFVLPSRGEGFGLPYAEAMMMSKPVIAPDKGGHLDFCTSNNSYLVHSALVPVAATSNDQLFRDCLWLEVDEDSLVESMIESQDNDEKRTQKGELAKHDIGEFISETKAINKFEIIENLVSIRQPN